MTLSQNAAAVFADTSSRSEADLDKMRAVTQEVIGDNQQLIVGVNGSYARREATSGSDVDLFVLYRKDAIADAISAQESLRTRLRAAGFKMPADGGVFHTPLSISVLSQTIGGMEDKNEFITRRMLLLLEGEWLYNESGFNDARTRLLTQYVAPNIRADQICMFLLNDIIRYWRTICVDFEYKVQSDRKAREIRLIKLRFSRMLLFFAGVMAVGATHGLERDAKITRLSELLALPAYKRVTTLAGDKASPALELYADFLRALDDPKVREALSQPQSVQTESDQYLQLRAKAQQFRGNLLTLLQEHFGTENPTATALML